MPRAPKNRELFVQLEAEKKQQKESQGELKRKRD